MKWPGLPVLVMLADRPVILLGDGEAAAAKRRLLERAGASVVDEAGHPFADRPAEVEARTAERSPALAIVAIEDEDEAIAAVTRLKARGLLVNAVDRPALCDFTLPAVVDRAPVLVAVATGGVSAGLAAAVRQRLEGLLPDTLGRLAEALAAARTALRARYPDAGERRRAIGSALTGDLDPFDAGSAARVDDVLLRHAGLVAASTSDQDSTLGSADDGECRDKLGMTIILHSHDPDDLTLRQARALALADRVFHAAAVPPAILNRARADAGRIACAARPAQMTAGDVWVEMA